MSKNAQEAEDEFYAVADPTGMELTEEPTTSPSNFVTNRQASRSGYTNTDRRVMSRQHKSSVGIVDTLTPGEHIDGCLVCCNAPACCPMWAFLPCCGDAEYITIKRRASTYVHIRENSMEWNEPRVVMQPGVCCGVDPCLYEVQDQVYVLYYDDVVFDRITDQTRFCNECRTCVCGGHGERIRMDSPICCSCCQRGSCPCVCIPVCCPQAVCPCILRYEIYLEDAQKGLYEIKKARELALKNEIYKWTDKQRIV